MEENEKDSVAISTLLAELTLDEEVPLRDIVKKTASKYEYPVKDHIVKDFVEELKKQGVKYREIADAIGVHNSNFCEWLKKGTRPGIGERVKVWLNRTLTEQISNVKVNQITIYPDDFSSIKGPHFQSVLSQMKLYSNAPFSSATFEEALLVSINWLPAETPLQKNELAYWKLRQTLSEHEGSWALVSDGEVKGFFSEYSEALQCADQQSFIACIGSEGREKIILPAILVLDHEIPPPQTEESFDFQFTPRGFYYAGRRWFVLPVKVGNKYFGVPFLFDTGSPITSITPATRQRLNLNENGIREDQRGLRSYKLEVNSKSIIVLNNPAAHNINLIGTDWIDQHIVVDNKEENSLTVSPSGITLSKTYLVIGSICVGLVAFILGRATQ
eukprot:TRINITY_DN21138_c0_g1_i2.p1 TRINITY_DN21138_c0_g1~~TRINITY_DN21138_c0_g1_i2.p1  ORF type:complete len:395 (+),score=41.76 TRINITY_DN21138_c0_g1_i2:25-1185(+)